MVRNLETVNRDAIDAFNIVSDQQLRSAMNAVSQLQDTDKLQCTINLFQTFVIGSAQETTGCSVDMQKPPRLQSWEVELQGRHQAEHFQPGPGGQAVSCPPPSNQLPLRQDEDIDLAQLLMKSGRESYPKPKPTKDPLAELGEMFPELAFERRNSVDSAAALQGKPSNFVPKPLAERGGMNEEVDAILRQMNSPVQSTTSKNTRPGFSSGPAANAKLSARHVKQSARLSNCKDVRLLYGRYLNAMCPIECGQEYRRSEIDLNQFLMNRDGRFAADWEGNFIASAEELRLDPDMVLEACLMKLDGSTELATIDLDSIVQNVNGHLEAIYTEIADN